MRLKQAGARFKPAPARAPTVEPRSRVLVIRVQFTSGVNPSIETPPATTQSVFDNVSAFYNENSYGQFIPSFTVTSAVYTLGPLNKYLFNGTYTNPRNLEYLLADSTAAVAVEGIIRLVDYDEIMILHAGRGYEVEQSPSNIQSLFYPYEFSSGTAPFAGFTVVPDLDNDASYSTLAVICHEYGHMRGLPDLYDARYTGDSTCGAWSVMDYPYGINSEGKSDGKNPPHLDPWSRNFLGYIDLSAREVSESVAEASCGTIETSPTTGYYKIPVDFAPKEYFIVEYRNRNIATFDREAPGSGILIWHIDDNIAMDPQRYADNDINSGYPHLGVDLVEADGSFVPYGSQSDAFGVGKPFLGSKSNAFDGRATDIAVINITTTPVVANFAISKIAASQNLTVQKVINYPNPAGPNYPVDPNKKKDTLTTFVFRATRPPLDLRLTIFSLSGEKVHSAGLSLFTINSAATADNRWVYEYDWNGRNDSGENVAPGVYIYRMAADNKITTGKLAIVR